jgi:DNA-binding MarR family transcriptional regulator
VSRPLERQTWQALRSLVLDRDDSKREVCEALDMSFLRIKALRRIATGPVPMRDLVSALGSDPAYATLIVSDLEDRGLVVRASNPADRRAKIVSATADGRRSARQAESILGRPPRGMRGLSDDELAELQRLVSVISAV